MRSAVLLAILVCCAALSGCLGSRERFPIDVDGTLADLDLRAAPVLVSGAPAVGGLPVPDTMGVAVVSVALPSELRLELTGVRVHAEAENATWNGQVARVQVDPGAIVPQGGAMPLQLENSTTLTVHFRLHDADGVPWLEAGSTVRLAIDVLWRYEDGPRFDADKVRLRQNVTVGPAADSYMLPNATSVEIGGAADDPRVRVAADGLPGSGGVLFVADDEGRFSVARLELDETGEAANGTLSRRPSSPSWAVVVSPWPVPDGAAHAEVVGVVGPDAITAAE